MTKVRTRIAPSPTGCDLHIGTVYMALFNYIFAKQTKGDFIVRIEDTDRERYMAGGEKRMLNSLSWVGIPHDEGVDVGGKYGPYRQSERLPVYRKYIQMLLNQGNAYYCFCSPNRLNQMRTLQQKNKQPPMYDGLCKKIPYEEAKKRAETEKYVVRLNVPDSGETIVYDLIRGEVKFENKLIDDQILVKSDGYPTYHLAVVVDDYFMEISHIIRGEEWLSSTPKHIILYKMFRWPLPKFAHMPLLRNADKSKLSKRRNPVWLSWFRKEGFLPKAILNYLGTLTWSMPDGRDIFSLQDMMQNFALKNIKTTAPIFDLNKLAWLNGEYIRMETDKNLTGILSEYSPKVNKKLIAKLVPLAKVRMKKLSEFKNYLKPFIDFTKPLLNNDQRILSKIFLDEFQTVLKWNAEILYQRSKQIVDREKFKIKDAFMALRIAVTGEKIGLPLFETMEILGKDKIIKRLTQSITAYENK